ncbi:peptidylprolyl isomerase [Henriciella litoralis]|uniref:peptidylprolyl isomerase n=1 Tax=Henriciella litoralis TaxID=568102 RepID=UPI00146E1843|nr:peptidylprolyl isomerase [Henriciella litoralis]
MLTMIRNMLRSKLAGLLFVLLIVAMAAWGVTDVFSGGLGGNLAQAGNTEFSESDLDREVERQLRTATDDRGRSLSKAQAVERGLVDQVYQRELFRTTLVAYASKLGAGATDAEVLDVIREDPAFESDTGAFDPNLYRGLLNQSGFTPASFEKFLKRDLTINRLTGTISAGLQTPEVVSSLQASYSGETRKAQWFFLERDALPEAEPISDDELTAFYDERKDALTNPQRRRVSILNLKVEDFLNQSEFSEDELRSYYDAVKSSQYAGPDTRSWTEFVFESEEEARSALGRIAGGAAPSVIPGLLNSADRTGQMTSMNNRQLAERVFGPTAQPGGIFGPFETGRLFTVARLESITPGEVEPFDAVREEIVDELSREQAIGLYYDSLSQLDNLIGTGASLESIGAEMGTPVLSFAPVDRSGTTQNGVRIAALQADPDILMRAFELTEGGKTSRFGQDETAYILRVDSIVEPFTPDLEDIRDDLRLALEAQRDSEALNTTAQSIQHDIASGALTLEDAAETYDANVVEFDQAFTRVPGPNSQIPPALAAGVFSLKEVGDIYLAPLQTGQAVAVVQLTSIEKPAGDALQAASSAASTEIESQLTNDLLEAFVAEIQSDVKLKVNDGAFSSYKARVNPDT